MPWIIPLATAAYSIGSSAVASSKAKKAEKAAEESLKSTPKYTPNASILRYYDEALRKYNTSPTDTAAYKRDKQNIGQGTVQALSSLNKLRSGNVANIIQGQNNSLLNAAVKSENNKAREFSVLGQATGMKAGEERAAFQQNKVYPFEAGYNLLTMKAGGYRASQRQETQNAFNNLSAAASVYEPNYAKQATKQGLKNTYGNNWRDVYKKNQSKAYSDYLNQYNGK